MIKNYLITFWRHFRKHLLFSFLNITSLVSGTAVFIFIFLYVNYQKSYDDFWPGYENIYRLSLQNIKDGVVLEDYAGNVPAMFQYLKQEFPEVEKSGFIGEKSYISNGVECFYKNNLIKKIYVDKINFASPHIFEILPLEILFQKTDTLLNKLNQVIISESTAKKILGENWQESEKLMDLQLNLVLFRGKRYPVEVTAIYKDLPDNSHLDTEMFVSHWHVLKNESLQWGEAGLGLFHTYVTLHPSANVISFYGKVNKWFKVVQAREQLEFYRSGYHMQQEIIPLQDIYLSPDKMHELKPGGNKLLFDFLLIGAIIILILSWINYINLSISNAVKYSKEIGLRKTLGGTKKTLIAQFLLEAILYNFIVIVLVLLLLSFLIPVLNSALNLSLQMKIMLNGAYSSFAFAALILVIYLMNIFFSGIYPALILSSSKPLILLNTNKQHPVKFLGSKLENTLVIGQFAASIILVSGAFIMSQQVNLLQSLEKGFNAKNIVVVESKYERDSIFDQSYLYFKQQCENWSFVNAVTSSSTIPGEYNWSWNYKKTGSEDYASFRKISIDHDFFSVFQIPVIAGRDFSSNYEQDRQKMIINEAALKVFGFENPNSAIGEYVHDNISSANNFEIIGVIKNYHHLTAGYTIEPTVFILSGGFFSNTNNDGEILKVSNASSMGYDRNYIIIKFSEKVDVKNKHVQMLHKVWDQAFAQYPFNYSFLLQHYQQYYNEDQKIKFATISFSVVVMIISILGLLGLALNNLNNRTKEIAVRKILGASAKHLLILLNFENIKVIIFSSVIAIPLAYLLIQWWLQKYAVKIGLDIWDFLLPVILIFIISLLTIGKKIINTVATNPVKELRAE